MAWITTDAVTVLLQTDLTDDEYVEALINHAQALAEVEVGTVAEPSAGLKAVLAQVVARMWQAGKNAQVNPAAMTMEVAGPFTFQTATAGVAGLGLTNREKDQLKKAAGSSPFWVQPTTRGDILETPPITDDESDTTDAIELLASAQADMPRPS